jgi:Flp pilus assembly protein TadG
MRNLTPALARRVTRLLRRDERGAVGVLIAILLTFGVLTGMGALVVDVGQIYQNRAELQNGADAGAVAVAKTCALGTCNTSVAQPIAAQNAKSRTEGIDLICGSGTLGGCPASTGSLIDCPAPIT